MRTFQAVVLREEARTGLQRRSIEKTTEHPQGLTAQYIVVHLWRGLRFRRVPLCARTLLTQEELGSRAQPALETPEQIECYSDPVLKIMNGKSGPTPGS